MESNALSLAKALEELGNSAEFASERALLTQQTYTFIDAWGTGAKLPLFNYNFVYQAKDYDDANLQIVTRTNGLAQAAGGTVIATSSTLGAMGACTGTAGVGCAVSVSMGAAGAAYGSDLAASGIKTVYTGKYHSPIGSQALTELTGISQETADFIYGAPSIVFGVKPIAMGVARIPKSVNSNEKLPLIGKSKGYEEQIVRLSGGEYRANLYSKNWEKANLIEVVDKFAGKNPIVTITPKGKKIYENPITKVQVVEDLNGKYFRIFDPRIQGRRAYLDLNGNVPSNKVLENGKEMGRSKSEYNQVTHFLIGE